MKISIQWLREWINPSITNQELSAKLTMAGLEVDALTEVAESFTNVIVGEVLHVEKHPNADRLRVCQVNVGQPEALTIVCGATNVRQGLKVAAAIPGAVLPNNFQISQSKIRDVVSNGMLCSARELGMSEEGNGIIELPNNAPVGMKVWDYLLCDDVILDVAITPNRGDCLSVKGLAHEIYAVTGASISAKAIPTISPVIKDSRSITIDLPAECPRYVGRVIRNVKADAITPIQIQERLRRSGIRCISPIVDVMNYVMLELGQPMHAFDLQEIIDEIIVRDAKEGEELTLLDGQTCKLHPETLVIADKKKPLAIAGVMGGLDSGVTLLTKDIFLESAYFSVESIARSCRRYVLQSESSFRFERGIDPLLQAQAIERATELLLEIVGGEPGPVVDITHEKYLPQAKKIILRIARMQQILGLEIPEKDVETILTSLGFGLKKLKDSFEVVVPARRSDINVEVDLIEEVMRLYGYDKLPSKKASAMLTMNVKKDDTLDLSDIRHALLHSGYHEVITYSFVDKKLQNILDPAQTPKELINPITAEMNVMRTNLWPGLIQTLVYNLNRQQSRVRIFETGLRFIGNEQQNVLSGLIHGPVFPLQWGTKAESADFFDLKGDIENILKLGKATDEFHFKNSHHPVLHPGQSTDIYRNDQCIGVMGALHPEVTQTLGLPENTFIFELVVDLFSKKSILQYKEISKFPEIRRDIAIFVDQTVPSQAIQDTIEDVGEELLKDVIVFDVYHQGNDNRKSIALALTLQHNSRTLVDEEVTDVVERIVVTLKQRFAAELRG
jgi:phenylalanyl-tRNA synthetase beta chain